MVQFQKLTRNVFLNLHGHNVHRQQRQLSKFLLRYQQFASHAYCGAILSMALTHLSLVSLELLTESSTDIAFKGTVSASL
jgi:hypothetical protein